MIWIPFLGLLALANAANHPTIPVKLVFLEALAPRDTTSSEAFRKEFQSTIELGLKVTRPALARCGYSLDTQFFTFDANDQLQAFERAKDAEAHGAWMIVGPRRSNHYLLVAKGAPQTPAVSLMASSSEVQALGPRFITLYPFNDTLAEAAAKLATGLKLVDAQKSYLTVISEDCLMCRDFLGHFARAATRRGFKNLGQVGVLGDSPSTEAAVQAVLREKPGFVLLPNYSKVSALLMGAIHEKAPQVQFLGGDGWGDQKFGFVEKNPAVRGAPGISVRGYPPVEQGLKEFALGRQILKGKQNGGFVPSSGPGLAILKIIEGVQKGLCQSRSQDREKFRSEFEKAGKNWFHTAWGISAYQVKDGAISYWKKVR